MRTEKQKESHRTSCHKYYHKNKGNPEFREKCRQQRRDYYQRTKDNPMYRQNTRERSLKRYYEFIKPNESELDKFRNRNRLLTQKYREKKQEVRKQLQALLGGECVRCGLTDYRLLDFDHIDPQIKTMNIS